MTQLQFASRKHLASVKLTGSKCQSDRGRWFSFVFDPNRVHVNGPVSSDCTHFFLFVFSTSRSQLTPIKAWAVQMPFELRLSQSDLCIFRLLHSAGSTSIIPNDTPCFSRPFNCLFPHSFGLQAEFIRLRAFISPFCTSHSSNHCISSLLKTR